MLVYNDSSITKKDNVLRFSFIHYCIETIKWALPKCVQCNKTGFQKKKNFKQLFLDNYYEYRNTNRKLCCLKIENWYLQTCEKNLMLYF